MPDPLGDIDGPNVMRYAGGNPINWFDSTGLACGPGGAGDIIVPEKCAPWMPSFTSACAGHDSCYGSCGAKKKDCDKAFKKDMLDLCRGWLCRRCAGLYYQAVSKGGRSAYRKAQKAACKPFVCDIVPPSPIG